jgi:chorismate binding enzyme
MANLIITFLCSVNLRTGMRVETCPISGTIERGSDPLEDAEQVKKLLANRKEESELTMCTDVDRNDKSRICNPGTVKILGELGEVVEGCLQCGILRCDAAATSSGFFDCSLALLSSRALIYKSSPRCLQAADRSRCTRN